MTTVTYTASGSFTCPAGVTTVDAQCWGAGGKGGSWSGGGGGGGGGGEYAEETSLAVTPGNVYTFTIGAGGTGTATSFPGDSVTVTAHAGGSGSTSATTAGSGGTGSSNSVHHNGGAGGAGTTSANAGGGGGGSGGASGAGGAGGAGSGSTAGSGGSAGSGSPGGAAGGQGGAGAGVAGHAGTAPGGGGGGNSAGGGGGGAGAAGQITLIYTASGTTWHGSASLTGTGTLTAGWAYEGAAALSGSGTMTAAGAAQGGGSATLSGSGTMTAGGKVTYEGAAPLSGSGTMTAASVGFGAAALAGTGTMTALQSAEYAAALAGSGTLGAGTFVLGFSAALAGTGTLGVARVLGVVTAGASRGVTTIPYAWPGSSQVAVSAPGSSTLYWLGTLGQVTALTYSYACPGGCDKLTCTVMVPASYRTSLFNPGWQVQVFRGGHRVWAGKMDEPVPSVSGWTLTATGVGNLGQDYVATYTSTWPASEPDQAINGAISRGLPWVNPGVGSPAGLWTGQAVDSGAQTITALLNLVCTRGGLTWYVNSQPGGMIGNSLSVFPLPATPNRLLVCTTPVARTLGGDLNSIFVRYEISADTTDSSGNSTPATYGLVNVQNSVSVAQHGTIETYIDLSDASVMTAAQAEAVAEYVLEIYQRASFGGPFTVHYGQLLNAGGQPIDIGTDQSATTCRLILTDEGLGGEVAPGPITFITAGYQYDDFAQTATITPYQTLNQNLTSLLSMENTLLTPIAAASG